jgi:hypothetical protein
MLMRRLLRRLDQRDIRVALVIMLPRYQETFGSRSGSLGIG